MTSLIKIRALLVPNVSYIFRHSRNTLEVLGCFFLGCTMFICLELNSGAQCWFLIYHHSLLGLLFTV